MSATLENFRGDAVSLVPTSNNLEDMEEIS
jgi:hypothetical protein